MAASVTVSVRAFSTSNVSSLTTSAITPSGSNRLIVAHVASGAGSPTAPADVKWGGSGGSALTQQGSTQTVSAFGRHTLWSYTAPAASSATGYVDWGTNQDETLVIFEAWQDVDQTTPLGTVASATGSDASPTVNATTVSGDLTLDGVFFLDQFGQSLTLSAGSGQTSIQEIDGADTAFEGLGSSYEIATGTSTTMSWTISGSAEWGIFACAVNGAAGGAPAVSFPPFSNRNIRRLIHH